MAPAIETPNGSNGHNGHEDSQRTVTVLVTGFGPFQDKFPVNPSFEITKSLPESLRPSSRFSQTKIRIISYSSAIRVCYDEVLQLVPKLHDGYAGTVDLVLHIGMASGRKFYCAERYGHRDGYQKNKDLDGITPPIDQGPTIFPDCPSTMTTSLDYMHLLQNWAENIASLPESSPAFNADIRPSEDAGRYLCDYTYFNSLAYFGRRSGVMEGGDQKSRPVLFLHVPAESDGVMIEKGREVCEALIAAMVETYLGQEKRAGQKVDL
ncbi:unnamed protein product [Zymoseptoria tritici ST99CH_1E4]|uniref:Peptidase C15, pyroglutamyl peptidase I-like protein n=1 Tax=Zymoseptoria tritici ST99CH_1E4 TaxID=1276532 RepID=A0A2H1GJ50_ZYMTR|nr:unnamed protein product [Zymoseptoria tritici ST99CH_1E4]